jgi:ammonia channel protein AmtB
VIAIAGFFICPPVGAIVALVLANNARQRIEASGGRLSGLEQARAARIIAIIELVLTAIVVLVGAIGMVIGLRGTTSGEEEGVPHPTPQSMKVGIVQQVDHEASSVGSLSTSGRERLPG